MAKNKKLNFIPIIYRDWSIAYCEIGWLQLTREFYKQWQWKFSDVCLLWDGKKITVYRDREEQAQGMAKNILKRIDQDKKFLERLSSKILKEVRETEKFFKRLIEYDFTKISEKELLIKFCDHVSKSAKIAPKILITQHLPIYLENNDLKEKYKNEFDLCLKIRPQWEKIVAPMSDFICVKFGRYALKKKAIREKYARFIRISEIKKVISDQMSDKEIKNLKKELAKRSKHFLLAGGQLQNISLKEYLRRTGWKLSQDKIDLSARKIKGKATFVAKNIIKGRVHIIYNKKGIKRLRKGEILVAPSIIPEYVPFLDKVVAIITDEGGVTSHAAIIARELGIPAVIGTNIATKVLKDGDLVEVDANKGIIKILTKNGK